MNALLLALALSSSNVSAPVQTTKVVVIAVKAPTKCTCGAPRALENDSVQTVRVCEFK